MTKFYSLPELLYGYKDLEPYISEEQLTIHHQKHHAAYVGGANALLEKLDKARESEETLDMKATLKDLSWNVGGHVLHSLFWNNLSPADKTTAEPTDKLAEVIKEEFGNFQKFKDKFIKTAMSVEGSGWAALTFCKKTGRPLLMQIEKHNTNIYPSFGILLVLDMFEHSFYIDYKNDKGKYVENFWQIIHWQEVERRFEELLK